MNWMTRLAILFGRKKFEEFAQANPRLPDDALAIANTLDTHPVRGAVALITGSLAHAADNLLRGTETVDQLATHVLLILAGLCIIWVRHAISKHDVAVSQVVQKAREELSIQAQTPPPPPPGAGAGTVMRALIVALGFSALVTAHATPSCAQTNGSATTETLRQAQGDSLPTNTLSLFTQLVSDVGSATKFSSGVGANLHGRVAPLLSQELSLFGHAGTNSSWSTGPSHATFFLPAANEEQLGWSFSGSWNSPPRILRFALFNASDIDWTINWGLPAENYYHLFRHVDWRENRLGVSITRKF
ncbi:MAG TPA: hypothetical protein VMV72_18510 [Verrucomicrobiae bacterium]|nr:hypothetical protein [Verrucomicrobiae bacterium]